MKVRVICVYLAGWVSAQGGSLQQPDDLHAGDVDAPQTLQQQGQEEEEKEKEDVPGHQARSGHHCRQPQEQQRDIYGERRIRSICSSHMEGSRTKRKRSL